MTPNAYCEEKAAKSGSSFYYSFKFLPRARRESITALYAFCREVDDVVDDCTDLGVAATTLNWWRLEVDRIYAGCPEHPVGKALLPCIKTYDLPREHFLEIIDGMQMDLQYVRYESFKELQLYCYRVASVVGLLAARIFGYQHHLTQKFAHDLGMALQLTNIIRDVGEDARRGRIYVPIEELEQFKVPANDILQYRETEAFARLMEYQIERARKFYHQALNHLPEVDKKSQKPSLIMAAIYRATLEEIALDGPSKVLNQHLSLGQGRKIGLALKTWLLGYHAK